jgi:ATP adenylyltransferase
MVNHVVGSMNLGTLIVSPKEHVVAVADLDDAAVAEFGPVLRDHQHWGPRQIAR